MSTKAIRFQRILERTNESPDYWLDENGHDTRKRRERDPGERWDDMVERQGKNVWGL